MAVSFDEARFARDMDRVVRVFDQRLGPARVRRASRAAFRVEGRRLGAVMTAKVARRLGLSRADAAKRVSLKTYRNGAGGGSLITHRRWDKVALGRYRVTELKRGGLTVHRRGLGAVRIERGFILGRKKWRPKRVYERTDSGIQARVSEERVADVYASHGSIELTRLLKRAAARSFRNLKRATRR